MRVLKYYVENKALLEKVTIWSCVNKYVQATILFLKYQWHENIYNNCGNLRTYKTFKSKCAPSCFYEFVQSILRIIVNICAILARVGMMCQAS